MKLVSINIESDKHLKTVRAFLRREDADVVCLMEVFEHQVELVAGKNYPYRIYAPNCRDNDGAKKWGVALLSKTPLTSPDIYYCGENGADIPEQGMGTHLPLIVLADIAVHDQVFRVGAVHFSWTADGGIDDRQRGHVEKLLAYLDLRGEFVVSGDFNIPRPNEMYQKLAAKYTDAIPSAVTTTLDPHLHRVNKNNPGKLAFVVDYVWTTPMYHADNVRVVSGVSDHCGVVADITLEGSLRP